MFSPIKFVKSEIIEPGYEALHAYTPPLPAVKASQPLVVSAMLVTPYTTPLGVRRYDFIAYLSRYVVHNLFLRHIAL